MLSLWRSRLLPINYAIARFSTSKNVIADSLFRHIGRAEAGLVKTKKSENKVDKSQLLEREQQLSWESAGINEDFAHALRNHFEHLKKPIGVQSHAISYILSGRSAIVADQCGSGKTVIF